jgi:hypothetical protein
MPASEPMPPASEPPPKRRKGKNSIATETNNLPNEPTYDTKSIAPTHWFHQEFVPALRDYEFRVGIVTDPSKDGLRGRRGRVFKIAKTAFNEAGDLASRELQEEDLKDSLTLSYLNDFSLWVFESLRARSDSMRFFESLEVGVRLDVVVAEGKVEGEKLLFVNEITRWMGAHYFSHNVCPEPKT